MSNEVIYIASEETKRTLVTLGFATTHEGAVQICIDAAYHKSVRLHDEDIEDLRDPKVMQTRCYDGLAEYNIKSAPLNKYIYA